MYNSRCVGENKHTTFKGNVHSFTDIHGTSYTIASSSSTSAVTKRPFGVNPTICNAKS